MLKNITIFTMNWFDKTEITDVGTYNGVRALLKTGALVIFLGLGGLASCTKVDDNLGAGMLPANQVMDTDVAWFGTDEFGENPQRIIETSLYSTDSLPSGRLGYGTLGQTKDNVFGARKNSLLLQFLPNSMPYDDTSKNYGLNPIVDSIYIVMAHNEFRGDTSVEQNFDVYNLNIVPEIPLSRDSVYRAKFDATPLLGDKLFTFKHSGTEGMAARMMPTEKGKEYLNKIVNLDWDTYKSNEGFRENFEGLYITPSDPVGTAAAAYTSDLSNSGMIMFVRNHDEIDPSAIYDTIVTRFTFRDSDDYDETYDITTAWDNVSINMTSFDYAGSAIEPLKAASNDFENEVTTDRGYVQTMGGVGTRLRLTDDFIEDLEALYDKNSEDILINQAMLYIDLEATGDLTETLDEALPRMGGYTNLPFLRPIPDYQYAAELTQREEDSTYRLPYGGYLNRSNSRYEIDLSAYVQRLIHTPDYKDEPYDVSTFFLLGPDATDVFGFGKSVLRNDAANPIRMRVTYTLIKK